MPPFFRASGKAIRVLAVTEWTIERLKNEKSEHYILEVYRACGMAKAQASTGANLTELSNEAARPLERPK